MECTIVRIMKTRKVMKHAALVNEVRLLSMGYTSIFCGEDASLNYCFIVICFVGDRTNQGPFYPRH